MCSDLILGPAPDAAQRRFPKGGREQMLRYALALGLASTTLTAMPALAVTKQQKLETCTFGADNQKLTGQQRKSFMARCMADDNKTPAATNSDQRK
jgi:hypothetical protein